MIKGSGGVKIQRRGRGRGLGWGIRRGRHKVVGKEIVKAKGRGWAANKK